MSNVIVDVISVLANVFTIAASGLALWIFFSKRLQISSVLKLLLSYSMQISLRELNDKLDQINNLRVAEDFEEIGNIFHDIFGQVRGNSRLYREFSSLIENAELNIASQKLFSEAKKRALVSEIREKLRHLDMMNVEGKFAGEKE